MIASVSMTLDAVVRPKQKHSLVLTRGFGGLQANQNAVTFAATDASQQIVNTIVMGNFVVASGFLFASSQSASVFFRGAPPQLTNTKVIWQVGAHLT